MDPNTLTLYTVAAGLSLCISLVMRVFAHFLHDTRLVRHWGTAVGVLSAALFFAGIGPTLPRWATVIGTNLALLAAGPIIQAGIAAYCTQREAVIDRFGWSVVALAAPAFAYWGLVEPNGQARAIVFSVAAAVINAPIATLLIRAARQGIGGLPTWFLGLLFGVMSAWMAGRAGLLMISEPPPASLRGANPTTWITVFWYIVLVATMSICALWLETRRLPETTASGSRLRFDNKLFLLWSGIILMIVVIVGILGIAYATFYATERARMTRDNEVANDAFARHTANVVRQVDVTLRAVRGFLQESRSIARTTAFIGRLDFDRAVIHNLYVIDENGVAVIAPGENAAGRNASHRDFFRFHRDVAEDQLFIGPVDKGQITGQLHFRMTRRIDNPDGSFGGLVLAAVDPEALQRHYRTLLNTPEGQASLVGTHDYMLRARVPHPPAELWSQTVTTPLWAALSQAPQGSYHSVSAIDGIERTHAFSQIENLPLVMVTGFSDHDLVATVQARMYWLIGVAVAILGFALLLALLLSIEAKRRDEQDRFMSMLTHELKTPMSVIRMTLDTDELPEDSRIRVARSVRDMNAVLERCRQADQLHHGLVSPTRMATDIVPLLADLCQDHESAARLVLAAKDLPACNTDPQLLRTILNNLIDNAIKYGAPASPIRIDAAGASQQGQSGVRITIGNAPGIAGKPDAERVFSKYYRAAGAHGKTGSGLGLHIASGFAAMLGGTLRYLPTEDEVRFELWIPC